MWVELEYRQPVDNFWREYKGTEQKIIGTNKARRRTTYRANEEEIIRKRDEIWRRKIWTTNGVRRKSKKAAKLKSRLKTIFQGQIKSYQNLLFQNLRWLDTVFWKSGVLQFDGFDLCILLFSEADMEVFIYFNVFSSKFC
jgi:hypothetical protein